MSQENVKIALRLLRLYNEGDLEALLEAFGPEAEIVTLVSGTYRGRSGVLRVAQENSEMMRGNRLEPVDVDSVRDHVIAEVEVRGEGRLSGIALVNERIALVTTFRDGLVIRQETFRSRAEALEAVGLPE